MKDPAPGANVWQLDKILVGSKKVAIWCLVRVHDAGQVSTVTGGLMANLWQPAGEGSLLGKVNRSFHEHGN
jgi:hypothetical protein